MRKLIMPMILSAAALAGTAFAQSGAITIVCEDCRNPYEHPNDWANFAFNQIYGDSAWLDFEQADDFWIVNLDGDRVYVDVDYVMTGVNLFGAEIPLWPTNLLQITLALPDGEILEVLRSIFMRPLPVPSPSGPVPDAPESGGGGGESGNDGVDEPEPGEDIVDPGPDDGFPEPEWCQEC